MAKNLFKRYKDPTGEFSNQELELGSWYLRNKLLLEKIALWTFGTISVSLGLYGVIGLGYYFLFGYFNDRDMLSAQVAQSYNIGNMHAKSQVQNLQYRTMDIFDHTPRQYDFVAPITNPNKRYIAHVTYRFVYADGQTPARILTILPESESYLHFFGQELDRYPESARFEILEVSWQRLDPRAFPDPAAYIDLRTNFRYLNFIFNEPTERNGLLTNQLLFDVSNDSAYDYKEVDFLIVLKNAGQVVGVQPLSLYDMPSRDLQSIDLRLGTRTRFVEDIDLIPITNVFDESFFGRF